MAANIFNGVPHNHQASGLFPSDPTITYFFYYDGTINKVYKHNSTSNTTTIHDIGSGANQLFPTLPTNQAMNRAVADGGSLYIKWQDPSTGYIQTRYSSPTLVGTGATPTPTDDNIHDARTANTSYAIAISPTRMIVRLPLNGWATDHQYNQGSWGGTTTPYTGLPQTGHRSINMIIGFNAMVNVFYDTGIVYTIDLSAQTVVSSAPYGSVATPNPIFFGVPHDHQASGLFLSDPTISYFFYYDGTVNKVYKHNSTTNTTTIHDIGSGANQLFPGLPTNQAMDRALFTQNLLFVKWKPPTGSYIQIRYTNSTTASGGQISSPSDVDQQARTSNNSYSVLINSANTFAVQLPLSGFAIDHLYTTGNWGGTTTPYNGLPQTLHRSMALIPGNNNQVLVFYDTGIVYTIDLSAQTVVSSAPYGATVLPPPTPLPDIEMVYSAPSQFNLFASDVALVTENQYGWNFTKTINDANKMELYLYHSSAPGATAFNYNDLRDITVNMKNNLVLPAGEIFVTVYTGPPVAPNWYNYKDIYNFTPPLGTTIDVNLVEHILNLTDARTDPILAIALHSNSAQQQVNCDVERVSFEILLPTTNETQRVIVKLQNNFIALDNHYWNLDTTATARLNTTIIPNFDINSFSPNIVAGNFPQNATAKEATSGAALFSSGTWQLWETTDGTTWTATPNATMTLTAGGGTPGPSSNGFAYIGTSGLFNNYGTGLPTAKRPVTWNVTTSNEFDFVWAGSTAQTLAPLANMTTPNNFTTAQMASGFFDTAAAAGTTSVGVWISSATSPSGDPVASRDIDIVVKSETEISIKRSWELSVTTYTINPNNPKAITGQYTDPAYTTSVAPTSFSMPSNWIEVANNDFRFQILFSAGLNNSLPAESQNFRQMTVTPSPTTSGITFTWVANYYTAGNILIGPVAGIQTTGLVSGFTTGGSLKPANAAYILYGCTSSENVDAINSLVFIEPAPTPSPPPVITSVTTEEAIISKINYHPNESHKIIDDTIISEIRFTLTDSDGRAKFTNDNIYYEIEVKEQDANP